MKERMIKPPAVLVTGAGGGLGLEIAVMLAARGCRVAAGLRDASRAEALRRAADAAGAGGRLLVLQMDVTDAGQVASAVRETEAAFGGIDVLVNNAGFAAGGFTEDLTPEVWRKQFDVNLFGAVEAVRAVLPGMRARGSGLIVQMSSISGRVGFPGFAPYAASKFALEGWSESLRHEVKPHGIDVVLIEPGAYRTDIWAKGFAALADQPSSGGYEAQLRQVLAYAQRSAKHSPSPARAAEAVVRIIMRRSGRRLRYPLGGVRLTLLARQLLPWRLYERIVRAVLARYK